MPSLIGNKVNQVPSNGDLGTMAFREQEQFLALAGAQTVTGAKTFSEIITASKGVAFPATQVASTDANTLDDYEEGTWTPNLQFGGASTGITYLVRNGFYTKIGNIVIGTAWIFLTSKGSATGDATLAGLPFTNAGSDGNQAPCTVEIGSISFADQIFATVEKASTFIKFREVTNAGTNSALTNADFQDSSSLQISFTYRV
jgi:hypothetical protein